MISKCFCLIHHIHTYSHYIKIDARLVAKPDIPFLNVIYNAILTYGMLCYEIIICIVHTHFRPSNGKLRRSGKINILNN